MLAPGLSVGAIGQDFRPSGAGWRHVDIGAEPRVEWYVGTAQIGSALSADTGVVDESAETLTRGRITAGVSPKSLSRGGEGPHLGERSDGASIAIASMHFGKWNDEDEYQ